jgi:hypothetical protein
LPIFFVKLVRAKGGVGGTQEKKKNLYFQKSFSTITKYLFFKTQKKSKILIIVKLAQVL